MSLGLSTALRNARNDAVTTAAGASALLRLYNGVRPATGGAATTLLAQLTMNTTFAPPSSNGVLAVNAIASQTSAAASGLATWFRIVKSDATFVMDGNVSTVAAGTGELRLDDSNIAAGGTVAMSSAQFTDGNP